MAAAGEPLQMASTQVVGATYQTIPRRPNSFSLIQKPVLIRSASAPYPETFVAVVLYAVDGRDGVPRNERLALVHHGRANQEQKRWHTPSLHSSIGVLTQLEDEDAEDAPC